jgi:hypothetical protein
MTPSTPSLTQRFSALFGSRRGGAVLFALIFMTIGLYFLISSHGAPYTPPKLTMIVNGIRIDGNPEASHQEEQYLNKFPTSTTIVAFRTLDQSPNPASNFLLSRWMGVGNAPKPERFYFTIGSSDFYKAGQGRITPFDSTAMNNILSNANCQGLYLHEIVSSFFYNPDGSPTKYNVGGKLDWWGVVKDQEFKSTLDAINNYVVLAQQKGKKIVWSEPSYGWPYMNSSQNPDKPTDPYYNATYNYMNGWGSTIIPMFADNFGWRSEKTAAMIGALFDGRVHSNNVFGQSVQGWQFTDPGNRKDLMYNVKVPATKTIPANFSYSSPAAYNATQNASMCANISNTLRDSTASGSPYINLPGVLADAQTIATCTYNSMNYGFSNTATVFQLEGPADYMDMYNTSPFMQGILNFVNDLPNNTAKVILPIAGTCDKSSTGYVGCSTPAIVSTNQNGISTKSTYTGQVISTTTWGNNSFTDPVASATSITAGPPAPAGWSQWNIQGGNSSTAPAAVSWGSGRIDLFSGQADNAVWHKWYANNAWNPGSTPYWESQGGASTTLGQAVSTWGANRLDVFEVRGGQVYQKTFDNGWGSWQPIINPKVAIDSKPAAVSWSQGRIDLFVKGSDNAIWHNWYQSGWHSWESLGGALTSAPSVASWGNGHLDVFARGYDNNIYHKWYSPYAGWSGWASLGNAGPGYEPSTAPAAVASGYGHIFVFYSDVNWHLYYKAFDLSSGWPDGNSGWNYMGGTTAYAPAVASWAQGRLDVFITGTDARTYNAAIQMNLPTYTPPADADNDGVLDSSDRCPNQFGTLSGCPDSDGDGIADIDDSCPTQGGFVSVQGCPVHGIRLFHYYNGTNYDSFYTTTRNDGGYAYYGYGFASCEIGIWDGQAKGQNMVPLYQYWNGTGGDHFYTIDRNDAGFAYYGYSFEAQIGWVYPPNSGLRNVFRYFAGGWIVDHYYGMDPYWSYPNYSYERTEFQGWLNGGGC